jgi:hypothetical protein
VLMRSLSKRPSKFGLAAEKLLLCVQAVGVHHQITPMTRTPAASTPGEIGRSARERFASQGRPNGDSASLCYVAIFFVALTGFLAAAVTLASRPLAAVLLALGAMALVLHSLGELLLVSQVQFEQSRADQGEIRGKNY